MALDSNIPLQVRTAKFDSPMESMGQAMQLQGLMQRQQLGQMQMDEHRELRADKDAIKEAVQTSGGDLPKAAEMLQAAGHYKPALEIRASINAQVKAKMDAQKAQADAIESRFKIQKSFAAAAHGDASDSGLAALGQTLKDENGLPEPMIQSMIADLRSEPDITKRQARLRGFVQGPEQINDLYKPKLEKRTNGKTEWFEDVNKLTNPHGGAEVAIQMTAAQESQRADAAASRGLTAAGQAETRRHNQFNEANPTLSPLDSANGPILVNTRDGSFRPVVDGKGTPLPPKMSASASKEIDSLDVQSATVQQAIKAATDTPSAFSMSRGAATLAGALPETIAGRMDSEAERRARAFVFNNVSTVVKERAGTAQTVQEAAKLRAFLPAETDSSDQIVGKLQAFQDYLKTSRQTYATPANERPLAQPDKPEPATASPVTQSWDSLPMPRDVPEGKVVRDTKTGAAFRRQGNALVPVK